MSNQIFKSYLMGGFECSTHRVRSGRRVDVIAGTRHDFFAEEDYKRMLEIGMRTARDGARWHLIEVEPFRYDFSSVINQVRAAERTGIQIIWDLFHYGYPDDLDIFTPAFVERFAAFSKNFAEFLKSETTQTPIFCPVNEISFFSWIAGDVGGFYPFAHGRGYELKQQLVRAEIASTLALREIYPLARFIHTDPAIEITSHSDDPREIKLARGHRNAQFQAFDMLCGKLDPRIGGKPEHLDIIGLNYYFNNQWRYPTGEKVLRGHPDYRPFHRLLLDYWERYERPIMIAETGIEDEERPEWFRYVCNEVKIALDAGAQIEGVCLYPIVNHPGWDDDRHCKNGLWCYPSEHGEREIYRPLADEIELQKQDFERRLRQKEAKRHAASA